MGPRPHPDRQLREARASYIAAVRRLDAALGAFDESGMPMDPALIRSRTRGPRSTSGSSPRYMPLSVT